MALSTQTNANLETFRIYWLDQEVHNDENKASQQILRTIINHLKVFDDENECEQVIKSVPQYDRIVLIVSGRLGARIIPKIHNLEQLSSIYIYCFEKAKYEQLKEKFSKIHDIFIGLNALIERIEADHELRRMEEESLSMISVFNMNDKLDRSSTGINGQFIYFQLLIDVLLRMKPSTNDKRELIALCKKEYRDNQSQIKLLDQFEKTYSPSTALRWYTHESFIYRMLNKALRVQNIDLLFLFRFFIRDIYQLLCQHQEKSNIKVYRGQWMSNEELEKLNNSMGHIISMNSFLSTSKDEKVPYEFFKLDPTMNDGSKQRVLFEITANPQVDTNKPFADISPWSCVEKEREVLFMLGSMFLLEAVETLSRNDGPLTIIKMSLCGDKHKLKKIYNYKSKEYNIGETNLLSLGNLLRSMGKITHAEKYYRRLFSELSETDPLLGELYYNLGLVAKLKGEYERSLEYYEKALQCVMKYNSTNHIVLANTYNGIGEIYWKNGDRNRALESFKEAVKIFEQAKLSEHVDMALFQDNMGLFYKEQENYIEALPFYTRSLMIRQKALPKNHPDIAMSYHNLGTVRLRLGQTEIAVEYFETAVNMRIRSLPPDHPDIAVSHKNLANLYESTNEFKLALQSYQEASKIYHEIWQSNHPDIIDIDKDIERITKKLERT